MRAPLFSTVILRSFMTASLSVLTVVSLGASPLLQSEQSEQDVLTQEEALARLEKFQAARTKIIAMVEPSVCSVMSLKAPGGGSGVIISPRGWALTNYHVTRTNKVMKIGLPDGKLYLADVIGIDPGGDISLMALRGKGPKADGTWPYAKMGDSDKLKIGGFAYAMGNPFLLASDFKPTVTMGIISGIHRYQKGTGPNGRMLLYPDCIQVDTPINPGNSGGPLFDENGLLIGINGRITVRDRGRVNTGAGFAVSINQIKNFLPDLMAGKHADHGTLSMNAWSMKDPNTGRDVQGIFVQAWLTNSPAKKAGVRLGDRVLAFNGRPIRFANILAREIGVLPSGFEVSLTVQHYDERTQRYAPEETMHMTLTAMDTGSISKEAKPNVPDFNDRPDFENIRAATEKKRKVVDKWYNKLSEDEKKLWKERLEKIKPDDSGDGLPEQWPDDWPDEWKDNMPGGGKDPSKDLFKDLYKKLKVVPKIKIVGPDGKPRSMPSSRPGRKKPKVVKRDYTREEAIFKYMDGLMADLRRGYGETLPSIAKRADRRLDVVVQPYRKGKKLKPRKRSYILEGEDLTITETGQKSHSIKGASKDSDIGVSLERVRDTNPLLRPWGIWSDLEDSYVESGIHIGGRVGYVCRIRGVDKRAVYLDRDGLFPLGYRYRSFRRGGIVDVRYVAFERKGGRLYPSKARVFLGGELVEELQFGKAENRVSFVELEAEKLPVPSGEIETRLASVFKSVVKVHGSSGFRGISNYGSGIVISKKGHIMTWNHVMLSEPGQIRVVLEDGSVHRAKLVKIWDDFGVAILRIPTTDREGDPLPLKPLAFPASRKTYKPGEVIFSVGNSFRIAEYAERVSIMIGVVVSTVRSDLRLNLRKFPFKGEVLMVDAPSAPGTQGGGLFTINGELIGMLTPIVESRETNSQLHLAIPAHELSAIVAYYNGDKKRARALASKIQAEKSKAPVKTGIKLFDTGRRRSPPAYIDRVIPGSPAAKSGLRSDDLIVRINDFPVQNCSEFRRALRSFAPGEKIDVTFKRGNSVQKVSLLLEKK